VRRCLINGSSRSYFQRPVAASSHNDLPCDRWSSYSWSNKEKNNHGLFLEFIVVLAAHFFTGLPSCRCAGTHKNKQTIIIIKGKSQMQFLLQN
jgi:hypothetical protein